MRSKQTAASLGIAAFAISLWGWFYPHPEPAVILALLAMPPAGVALLARTPDAYQFGRGQHDTRASLGMVLLFPAVTIAYRALEDFFCLVDLQRIAIYSGLATLAIVMMLLYLDRALRKQPWRFCFAIVLAACYASGVLVEINRFADRSVPRFLAVAVIDKQTDVSQGTLHAPWTGHTDYLTLAAWAPQSRPREANVPAAFYQAKQIGDTVCVELHRGAIGVAWFLVSNCPGQQ